MQEPIPYALEKLYEEQDHDFVIQTIPAVLAWVPDQPASPGPHVFDVQHTAAVGGEVTAARIALTWDVAALEQRDPRLLADVERYRTGRTPHREHLAEVAGYGLAMVAMSLFLPGVRVVAMNEGSAPDILYDDTPGALRGVEAAGRGSGGWSVLRFVRVGSPASPGKAPKLVAASDVAEAHLSLWCASPRVSEMVKVKP